MFFSILACLDLYSTLRFKDLVVYLEANPLFHYIGLPGIIGINILFIIGIYYWYDRSASIKARFYIVHLLTVMSATRIFVIWNNFKVYEQFAALPTELVLEVAQSVTQEMKTEQLIEIVGLQFLPIFMGLITFWLFILDHNVTIKENGT